MENLKILLENSMTTVPISDLNFILKLIFSFVLGYILYLVYGKFYKINESQDTSLARSIVILIPGFTSIFCIMQSNIMLSIGLLGSLSVIRFRTSVKRGEDIGFIILSIACSMSISIDNYIAAITIIVLLYIYTFFRNLNYGIFSNKRAIITFDSSLYHSPQKIVEEFQNNEISGQFISSRTYDGIHSFVFQVDHVNDKKHNVVNDIFRSLDKNAKTNIFFPDSCLGA